MMKKRFISIAVALAMLFSLAVPALAGGTKEDIAGVFVGDLKYWGNPFTYEASVVDYSTSCKKNLEIPETVQIGQYNYKVIEIDYAAFENSSIETVELPETVYKIKEKAFFNCSNLKEVIINYPGVEIEAHAFDGIASSAVAHCPPYTEDWYDTNKYPFQNNFPLKLEPYVDTPLAVSYTHLDVYKRQVYFLLSE